MRKLVYVVLGLALIAGYWRFAGAESVSRDRTQTSPEAQTQAVVTATMAFLNSLSADERKNVLFLFTPQQSATAATFKRAGMGGPGGPPPTPRDTAGRGQGQAPRRGPGDGPGAPVGTGQARGASLALWANSMARPSGRTFPSAMCHARVCRSVSLVPLGVGPRCICSRCCSVLKAIKKYSTLWAPIRCCPRVVPTMPPAQPIIRLASSVSPAPRLPGWCNLAATT